MVKTVLKQPHQLFMLTACLLFVFSFIFWGQGTNLHVGNTYVALPAMYFVWAVAILFLAVWSLYCLMINVLLTKYLTWFHFVATILFLLTCTAFAFLYNSTPRPYFDVSEDSIGRKKAGMILFPFAIFFLLGQVSYLVNLVGGLVRKLSKTRHQQ